MVGLDRERVRVEPADPTWREAYERERRRLDDLIGTDVLGFEHVGSTAVEGLPAKPVIDLLAVVDDVDAARDLLPALEANGYEYRPKPDESERLHLSKGPPDDRTHYLKLVERGSEFHRETAAFRDHLREHPDVAERYAELKRDLAERYPEDRDAYTEAKAEFVEDVLDEALGG
jgi:GrpB-like predicted nucleotidyltransferase (UPF0157 family)